MHSDGVLGVYCMEIWWAGEGYWDELRWCAVKDVAVDGHVHQSRRMQRPKMLRNDDKFTANKDLSV